MPNLLSLATSCVCLELRSLPSPGIYPASSVLRTSPPPIAPGLSLAGVRLTIPGHAMGFPCCVRLPCVHAAATTPVQQPGVVLARLTRQYQPSPKEASGRPAHRPFRGLLGVHSRCGLYTRAVTNSRPAIRRLQPFRYLHDCSGCFRLERLAGWGSHPLENAALSRRTLGTDFGRCDYAREVQLAAASPSRHPFTEYPQQWLERRGSDLLATNYRATLVRADSFQALRVAALPSPRALVVFPCSRMYDHADSQSFIPHSTRAEHIRTWAYYCYAAAWVPRLINFSPRSSS